MKIFLFSFFTFLTSYFTLFGGNGDHLSELDDYAKRSLTPKEYRDGYRNIQTHDCLVESDLEEFLFHHIFNHTKHMSHTHEKLLEIARKSSPYVLEYAVHTGFFHKMNTKSKISQLRYVAKISPKTLYVAHKATLLSSSDVRDRQYSFYYLQGISNLALEHLLSVLDFSKFDIAKQHFILKSLQGVDPFALQIMIDNRSLSFHKVGTDGGYKKQKHLKDRLKILENLKGKPAAFVEKVASTLTTEELLKDPALVVNALRVGEWFGLVDILPLHKKEFLENQGLLEGCKNRQKNKIIKNLERTDLEVLMEANRKGFLDFPPRERVRILRALQDATLKDVQNATGSNSKLIIKSLYKKNDVF